MAEQHEPTRQERRERRRRAERERMRKSGKSFGKLYANAVLKRAAALQRKRAKKR